MQAIWQIKALKPLSHRIIWWLVDVGATGKRLKYGWQKQCAVQLSIHRITVNRNVEIMVNLGILTQGDKRGEIALNTQVFQRIADKSKLKFYD